MILWMLSSSSSSSWVANPLNDLKCSLLYFLHPRAEGSTIRIPVWCCMRLMETLLFVRRKMSVQRGRGRGGEVGVGYASAVRKQRGSTSDGGGGTREGRGVPFISFPQRLCREQSCLQSAEDTRHSRIGRGENMAIDRRCHEKRRETAEIMVFVREVAFPSVLVSTKNQKAM